MKIDEKNNHKPSVADAAEQVLNSLKEKGFSIFADVDHQANAKSVDLEMPASRAIIFGNPIAGTKLMQADITASIDLPLRLAIVDNNGETQLIHQTVKDYTTNYQLENHPVLANVEGLFATLANELNQ